MLCYGLNGHMVTAVTVTVFALIFFTSKQDFQRSFYYFCKTIT